MTDANIFSKVQQIVSEKLSVDIEKVQIESDLIDDLGADSLDTVELVMAIEEAFSLEIPDDQAEKIRTVKDIVEYIQSHTSEA